MSEKISYKSPWWLPTAHLQTIYPYFFLKGNPAKYQRERLNTQDGDFIDFDWLNGPSNSPIIIVFHGLEGSSKSHYVNAIMQHIKQLNWRGVSPNFRGCSGTNNNLARAYHSGDHNDIDLMIKHVRNKTTGPIFTVGVSLGGNALLKWLSIKSYKPKKSIRASASISTPFNLMTTGDLLENGVNKVYSRHFLKTLKTKCVEKLKILPDNFSLEKIMNATTLRDFDNNYTAPAHGYRDVNDYWTRASSITDLNNIDSPTLLIHSKNDPFLPKPHLPNSNFLPDNILCLYTDGGGHVGFTSGNFPGNLSWLPNTLFNYFKQFL